MRGSAIEVLIADDHPVFRTGLRKMIADQPEMLVVGEATAAQETLDLVRATHADVLLLDITMPGALFPDILMRLSEERAELRVLVLSMHPEQQYAVRALRNGAAGYLTKDRSPEELITAIRTIASGGRYVTSTIADRLAAVLGSDPFVPLHEILSDREHEVLGLLAAGKTVKEIAERLSISPKTVGTYRGRILGKLHLRTNAELIRYALENGLGN